MNGFLQGSEAYLQWYNKQCQGEMPENPYKPSEEPYKHWEQGFDDAMEYILHGQYLDDDE